MRRRRGRPRGPGRGRRRLAGLCSSSDRSVAPRRRPGSRIRWVDGLVAVDLAAEAFALRKKCARACVCASPCCLQFLLAILDMPANRLTSCVLQSYPSFFNDIFSCFMATKLVMHLSFFLLLALLVNAIFVHALVVRKTVLFHPPPPQVVKQHFAERICAQSQRKYATLCFRQVPGFMANCGGSKS